MDLDRLPPHSLDAEQAVLGCILLNPQDCMAECVETMKPGPKVFYDLKNQRIYEKMLVLYDERSLIDVITVAEALKTAGFLDEVGGIPYLSGLADKTPSWGNLAHYLAILADKFRLRRVLTVCVESQIAVFERAHEPQAVVDSFERQALAISGELAGEIDFSIKPSVQNAIQTIERLHSSGGAITGLATGLTDYDKMTGGMKPGEMIVIGGRPSSGKSSICMNIADHVAIEQRAPVGVFSLEMSKDSLVFRMICCRARVNVRNIAAGFLAEREVPKLTGSAAKVNKAPIFIDDSPSLSVSQMRARARRMVSLYGIKLFIVDFLQRLYSTNPRVRSRAEEIADISNGIKTLAKELNLPVMALSQLNREMDKEKGRKPRLSDLKESSAIEQDADTIGLLYRPDRSEERQDDDAMPVNLLIAKQRDGPTGDIALCFLRQYTRFESAAKVVDYEEPRDGAYPGDQ
jgi:replicative DNA helicase